MICFSIHLSVACTLESISDPRSVGHGDKNCAIISLELVVIVL